MTYTLTLDRDWTNSAAMDRALEELSEALVGHTDTDGMTITHPVGGNYAVSFANEVFALRDFCWCEGSYHVPTGEQQSAEDRLAEYDYVVSGGTSIACPFNFEHFATGTKGVWYKHLGRDNQYDRDIDEAQAKSILIDCLSSLKS